MAEIYRDTAPGIRDQLIFNPRDPQAANRELIGPEYSVRTKIAQLLGPGQDTFAGSRGELLGTFSGPPDEGGYRDSYNVPAPMELAKRQGLAGQESVRKLMELLLMQLMGR